MSMSHQQRKTVCRIKWVKRRKGDRSKQNKNYFLKLSALRMRKTQRDLTNLIYFEALFFCFISLFFFKALNSEGALMKEVMK